MVIVTQNQYLLASKIHHVTMDEQINYQEIKVYGGKARSVIDRYHQITIIYSPDNVSNSNGQLRSSDEQRECTVIVRGAVNAHKVFHELIKQIREQMPDQLFLDTALERMIDAVDFETIEKSDRAKENQYESLFSLMEKPTDKKTKKPRKRKAKKKPLRRKK